MANDTHTTSQCRLLAAPAAATSNAALICARQQFAGPDHDAGADRDNETSTDNDGSRWTFAIGSADCEPVRLAEAS